MPLGRRTDSGGAMGLAPRKTSSGSACWRQVLSTAGGTLEQVEGGYALTSVHLGPRAKVPGADPATFAELAGKAKAGCPRSKLFKTEITLDAALVE